MCSARARLSFGVDAGETLWKSAQAVITVEEWWT
jgi:hypothetical protein